MRPKMQAYVPTRFTNNSTQRLRTRVGLNESRCARRLAGTSGANDEGVEIVDLSRLLRLVQTGRRQIMGCIALMLCLAAAAALPAAFTACEDPGLLPLPDGFSAIAATAAIAPTASRSLIIG